MTHAEWIKLQAEIICSEQRKAWWFAAAALSCGVITALSFVALIIILVLK